MSASTSTIRPSRPTRPPTMRRPKPLNPPPVRGSPMVRCQRSSTTPIASSRMVDPQGGQLTQRLHLREGDRFKRMAETQSAATLHLTKDQCQSSVSDLRGDNVDLSPSRQRQFRSRTCRPCRSNSAQASSSPRTPNCCLDSAFGIARLQTAACVGRSRIVRPHQKSVETART
jgi:hypothetical protein